METPCSNFFSCSSSYESSQCSSPPLSIQSDSSAHEVSCSRKLFDSQQRDDCGHSKFSIATFADTRKKLSFPSPQVSELHEHLQALDGLELSTWPFSRKHRSTPNTSPKKKLGALSIQKIADEIRAIETRTTELNEKPTFRNKGSASTKQKLWLTSLGFCSFVLVCLIIFGVLPNLLT
jgi:hypothetical protein